MKTLGLGAISLVILTTISLSTTDVCALVHHVAGCTVCHHGLGGSAEISACGESESLKMVRGEIMTPHGSEPVVFTGAYIRGAPDYDGICEESQICGHVYTVEGVVLSRLPGDPVTAGSTAYYCGRVDDGWSGTVTPVKEGYTFDPPFMVYEDVTSSLSNEKYTPIPD